MNETSTKSELLKTPVSRRDFIGRASIGALTASVMATVASCSKKSPTLHLDAGTGDNSLLNIAYAMEQLEVAFYTKVNSAYYINATAYEKSLLSDILIHEQSHKTLLESVLGAGAIMNLSFDFGQVDFTDRTKVLNFARLIENTGVAAYNGAAYLYKNVDFMAAAGKIVSVEARHATVINNLISFGNFTDNSYVDLSTGMERSITPAQALSFVNTYATKKISAPSI